MTSRFFPFHDIGFECNPFRALTDEEWVAVAVVPEGVRAALDEGLDNLQILGEKGYGKTTALLWMTAEMRYGGYRSAYEYIPEGEDTFQTVLEGLDFFLLDEGQRLGRRERGRLMRQSKDVRLVVAAHENLEGLFGKYGRPLKTIRLGESGPGHLRAILDRRLRYFALEGMEPVGFSVEAIDFLWGKFGRDVRAVEQYLYEYFQGLVEGG